MSTDRRADSALGYEYQLRPPTGPSSEWFDLLSVDCLPEASLTRCRAQGHHPATHTGPPTDRDVTGEVQWSSSDSRIVTVSGGVARSVSPGRAEIQIAGFGLTASCTLTVFPGDVPLPDGTYVSFVREANRPLGEGGIEGAVVRITAGHQAGRETTTRNGGVFDFPEMTYGPTEVRAAKVGYKDAVISFSFGTQDGPPILMERD